MWSASEMCPAGRQVIFNNVHGVFMKKTSLLMLSLILILPGCKSNVRDSSPSLLKDGVQLSQNKVTVDAQHAKVIMKASGATFPVSFRSGAQRILISAWMCRER